MSGRVFLFDVYSVDEQERIFCKGSKPIKLQPLTFDVLLALVTHPYELLSNETIVQSVWNGVHIDIGSLRFQMHKIRKIFGDDGFKYIETVNKCGYRFAAPVKIEE